MIQQTVLIVVMPCCTDTVCIVYTAPCGVHTSRIRAPLCLWRIQLQIDVTPPRALVRYRGLVGELVYVYTAYKRS